MTEPIEKYLIDKHCNIKGTIVKYNNNYLNCTLNQTDIKTNKNKYYIIQLIDDNGKTYIYTRYGRIGEQGKIDYKSANINQFLTLFKSKTGNNWGCDFVKKPGKYFLTEIIYDNKNDNNLIVPQSMPVIKSILDEPIFKLIQMLSNINMFTQSIVSYDIDTKKLPLGKISNNQLDHALDVLNTLINNLLDKSVVNNLSSEFYTCIPMDFKRNKPTLIDNMDLIDKYKNIIQELKNIKSTLSITENKQDSKINEIDNIYNNVGVDIAQLNNNSEMFNILKTYFFNTIGSTHKCNMEILDIFEVNQKYKNNNSNLHNTMLLFHGTSMGCVLSIFKNDFYLDPTILKDSNIQIAGKMFGYGVYFADCSSKSLGYTRYEISNNIACFIVCEVQLGNIRELTTNDSSLNYTTIKKDNYDSVKGLGCYHPSSTMVHNGVIIPNGKLVGIDSYKFLYYNEYIVYNINQIRIKYLMIVKNN